MLDHSGPVPIREAFRRRFDLEPEVVVDVPGRVNLIGDHTDYSLLPVLPIAIDRSIQVAASPSARLVVESIGFEGGYRMGERASGWARYVDAAVGVLGGDQGASVLIGSDLPATGGLSSSTALTLGVLAALGRVWRMGLEREALPGLCVTAERSLGVEGGLMDQIVIVHAERNAALRIDFDPPAHRPVPIPDTLAFVAAYSGAPAAKGAEARDAYNTGVVSSRAAAATLGVMLGLDVGDPPALSRVASMTGVDDALLGLPALASVDDVGDRFGVDSQRIVTLTAETYDPTRPLRIRTAAQHAISEARRVDLAEAALNARDAPGFGLLLDESHASLQAFGSSSPGLEVVVGAMRAGGSFGARVTGAGFGGYAVAACSPSLVTRVVEAARDATGGPAFQVRPSGGLR